jgi:hypothetical protein
MLFYLLAGHALMDYPLQGDAMSREKCRRSDTPLQKAVPWYYWLTFHALLHGLAVAVVVQFVAGFDQRTAVAYGIAETVIHWFIDFGKCERLYSIHMDQFLHITCKVVWWVLLANGIGPATVGL